MSVDVVSGVGCRSRDQRYRWCLGPKSVQRAEFMFVPFLQKGAGMLSWCRNLRRGSQEIKYSNLGNDSHKNPVKNGFPELVLLVAARLKGGISGTPPKTSPRCFLDAKYTLHKSGRKARPMRLPQSFKLTAAAEAKTGNNANVDFAIFANWLQEVQPSTF